MARCAELNGGEVLGRGSSLGSGFGHIRQMRPLILCLCLAFALRASAEPPEKKVARLWKTRCSACHGLDGRGQTETGLKLKLPDFTRASWQQKTTDAFIRDRVTNGISEERDGVKKEMPSFREEVTPEHLDAIIALLRKLGAPSDGPAPGPGKAAEGALAPR